MAWKKIVLSNPLIHRMNNHNGEHLNCSRCSGDLEAGDECYSHYQKGGTVYYCLECYDKLWL